MSMAIVPQSPPKWQTTWGLSPCAALTYLHAEYLKIFRILLCPGFLVKFCRGMQQHCVPTQSSCTLSQWHHQVIKGKVCLTILSLLFHWCWYIFKWHLFRFLSTTILLISRDHLLPGSERVQPLCPMVHSSFHRRVSGLVLRDAATVAVCLFQAVPLGSTSNRVTM